MSERYTQLFKLDSKYYQAGSPVIIIAGALLKDNQNGSVLAQIKYKSISDAIIKAIKVSIMPLSTLGECLGASVEHQYLDLKIERDSEFGQREPIRLPDNKTRQFMAKVIEVAFEDNTVWAANNDDWKPIEDPKPLERVLGNDPALLEQYRMEYGRDSVVFPVMQENLWICSCGGINRFGEKVCHSCRKEGAKLFAFNKSILVRKKEERLHQETYDKAMRLAEQDTVGSLNEGKNLLQSIPGWKDSAVKVNEFHARIEQLTKQAEKAAKKKKKVLFGITAGVLLIAACILLTLFVFIPNGKYNDAVALMNEGRYEEAIAAFEAMDGYKDSNDMIEECCNRESYDKAVNFANAGEYEKAISVLKTLSGYLDSDQKIKEYGELFNSEAYQKAMSLLESKEYLKAKSIFDTLSGYSDSDKKALECMELWNKDVYDEASKNMEKGEYESAIALFEQIKGYSDSDQKRWDCEEAWNNVRYHKAMELFEKGSYEEAEVIFTELGSFSDAIQRKVDCQKISMLQKAVYRQENYDEIRDYLVTRPKGYFRELKTDEIWEAYTRLYYIEYDLLGIGWNDSGLGIYKCDRSKNTRTQVGFISYKREHSQTDYTHEMYEIKDDRIVKMGFFGFGENVAVYEVKKGYYLLTNYSNTFKLLVVCKQNGDPFYP